MSVSTNANVLHASTHLGRILRKQEPGTSLEKLIAVELANDCRPRYMELKHRIERSRSQDKLSERERLLLSVTLQTYVAEVNTATLATIRDAQRADACFDNDRALELYRQAVGFFFSGRQNSWDCIDQQGKKQIQQAMTRLEMLALETAHPPPPAEVVRTSFMCVQCGFSAQHDWKFCGHCGGANDAPQDPPSLLLRLAALQGNSNAKNRQLIGTPGFVPVTDCDMDV